MSTAPSDGGHSYRRTQPRPGPPLRSAPSARGCRPGLDLARWNRATIASEGVFSGRPAP